VTSRLSAIVVVYRHDEAARCLRAVGAALGQVSGDSELVVVLNTRDDAVHDVVSRNAPHAVRLESHENVGFAGGAAGGVAASTGEWIALLNDDCVVEVDSISQLLAAAQGDDRVGAVAAHIRFARRPGVVNSAGLELDALGVAYERLLGDAVGGRAERAAEVFGASGTFALYRRAMLDDVGGFDESFFAYLEDADLAWRARMRGWRCLYAPGAIALHAHSPTLGHGSPGKHYLVGRNRVRMLAKNATTGQLIRRGAAIVAYDCAYVAAAAIGSRSFAPLRGRLRGLREWRAYRALGAGYRRPVALASPRGVREALRRNRIYSGVAGR
jgi:GT2 family glycosyltransferase